MTLDEVRALKRKLLDKLHRDRAMAQQVAARFAFKYVPKEKKQHKVERLAKLIRDKTGLSRGVAEDIVDAIIRKRDIEGLSRQKKWPIEEGEIVGSKGRLTLRAVRDQL